jgi:hypothetical protein
MMQSYDIIFSKITACHARLVGYNKNVEPAFVEPPDGILGTSHPLEMFRPTNKACVLIEHPVSIKEDRTATSDDHRRRQTDSLIQAAFSWRHPCELANVWIK